MCRQLRSQTGKHNDDKRYCLFLHACRAGFCQVRRDVNFVFTFKALDDDDNTVKRGEPAFRPKHCVRLTSSWSFMEGVTIVAAIR